MEKARAQARLDILQEAVQSVEETKMLDQMPGWNVTAPTPDETPTEFQRMTVQTQVQTTQLPMDPPKERDPMVSPSQVAMFAREATGHMLHSAAAAVKAVQKYAGSSVQHGLAAENRSDFLKSQQEIMFQDEEDEISAEGFKEGNKEGENRGQEKKSGTSSRHLVQAHLEGDQQKGLDTSNHPEKEHREGSPMPSETHPHTQPPEFTLSQPAERSKRSVMPELLNSIWANVTSPFRSPKKKPRVEKSKIKEGEDLQMELLEKMVEDDTGTEEPVTPQEVQPCGEDEEVVKETPLGELPNLDSYPDVPLPDPLSVILHYHDIPVGGDADMLEEQQESLDIDAWLKICSIPVDS